MGELIKVNNEIVESEEKESRIVDINLADFDKNKAAIVLSQIVDEFKIAKEKLPDVKSETRYYLDLTKEMKDKLESGECWFTEKTANGHAMGQLRHRVDGKSVIFANPDIKAEDVAVKTGGNSKSLSDGVYQVALQQQMAEMSKQIAEIKKSVVRIEVGQMDDRLAKIDAGEKTLRLAYATEDVEKRNMLIGQALPLLQEGSESIKRVVSRRLSEFEAVPQKGSALKLKMWLSPTNYVEKKNHEFDEIQTCFEYYDKAQKLSAMACLMMNEPKAMEEVFFQQENFIHQLPVWKLKSMKNLHYNIDFSNEWFSSPKNFVDEKRLEYLDFSNGNYDHMLIEVSGEQLLEVLDNDKTE